MQQNTLEDFFSAHSEENLIEIKSVIERLIEKKREEKDSLPLSIFVGRLNPAEALVKFLHENRGLSFADIARRISRGTNAVWLNYQRALEKKKSKLKEQGPYIPLEMFEDSRLSYLESIVLYFRDEKRYKNKEVAKMLGRSQQVVSLAYNRAKEKL